MKGLAKFSPLIFSFSCWSQGNDKVQTRIEFGYNASTFIGTCANPGIIKKTLLKEPASSKRIPKTPDIPVASFGWKQGIFFWVNLNSYLAYKPEFDISYSVNTYGINYNNRLKKETGLYSTAIAFEFKPQIIIRPRKVNKEPIVKIARSMSYYLSGRQPYFILGPKFSYTKSDKNFRKENCSGYYTIGNVIGIGFDNMFHNLDLAPELTCSIEYQTGNFHEDAFSGRRYFVSAALTVNLF
jgi:hypothetical protein